MPKLLRPKKSNEKYTLTPMIIFEILSLAPLGELESMVLNYILGNSINVFGKGLNLEARQWVVFPTSEFARSRNVARWSVIRAQDSLIKKGLIEDMKTVNKTRGGEQVGRSFKLVSNEKLRVIYEMLISEGCHSKETPFFVDNSSGCHSKETPLSLQGDTFVTLKRHLCHSKVTPWDIKALKSLVNSRGKYSLNTINNFLNTFSEFENSFLELYYSGQKTKASHMRIKLKLSVLIARFGAFQTVLATTDNLFDKTAQIGDIDSIEAYLKTNLEKLKIQENELKTQCGNVFDALYNLHIKMVSEEFQNLEIFYKNFRTNASVLLERMKLEETSSNIFLYSSFQKDALEAFLENKQYDRDQFKNEMLENLDHYFKAKLLGIQE